MNYALLKTELSKPEYDGLSDEQAMAKLNEPAITHWREVPKPDVENYVRNNGISAKLSVFLTTTDARIARGELDFTQPANQPLLQLYVAAKEVKALFSGSIPFINGQNQSIQTAIAGFVQGGIFSQAEADSFFSLFKYKTSKVEDILGQSATPLDIKRAHLWPQIEAVRAHQLRVASGTNRATGALNSIEETLLSGEDAPVPDWDAVAALWSQED